MKTILNELITVITVLGSIVGYWFFSNSFHHPYAIVALVCLIPGVWALVLVTLSSTSSQKGTFLTLGGLSWSQADFVRGWLITGRTGSGKTAAAICNILEALFKNGDKWGGVCIDDKGLFFRILLKACNKYGQNNRLALLQVRPENAPPDWKPRYTYNLISDLSIPASSYAKTIVDVTKSLGGEGGNPFFITQAGIQIERAIEFFRILDPKRCNLNQIYLFFATDTEMSQRLGELADLDRSSTAYRAIQHFTDGYLKQSADQRSGVKATIENCLSYFTQPDIAEIFCPEENSIDFSVIDQGVILSISLPNKYEIERRYINTFLKLAYYKHALRRFDKSEEERIQDNLLVLIADEAQQIVTSAQSGTSDFNVIDKIREAKATGIYATQSTTSFVPSFGSMEKTKVFLLNLGNHIYFTLADADAAELAAKHIGERTVSKMNRSNSPQGTSYSYSDQDEYILKPFVLRNMKKFECVIVHCENGHRKTKLRCTDLTTPTEAATRKPPKSQSQQKSFPALSYPEPGAAVPIAEDRVGGYAGQPTRPVVIAGALPGPQGEAFPKWELPTGTDHDGQHPYQMKVVQPIEIEVEDLEESQEDTENSEQPPEMQESDQPPVNGGSLIPNATEELCWPRSEIENTGGMKI